MGWIDVSKELIIEEVQLSDHAPILLYSHKFGPVLSLAHDSRIVALSGMKSGNYKAEIEYVGGKWPVTVTVSMREPAELFKKGK